MLRQRRIQTKVRRSLRDRSHVIQVSSKQALRMRGQAAKWRTTENHSRRVGAATAIKSAGHVGSALSGSSFPQDHGRTFPRKPTMTINEAGGLSKTRLGRLHK